MSVIETCIDRLLVPVTFPTSVQRPIPLSEKLRCLAGRKSRNIIEALLDNC